MLSEIIGRKCNAVIFDLDGVLIDTADLHFRAWMRLANEIGVPFDRQKNNRLRGVDRMRSLEIILEDTNTSKMDLTALADRKNKYYQEMIAKITPDDLFDGVADLLDPLRQKGVKIGIASSSKNARAVISKVCIEESVDAIVDGNNFSKAKPAPELFLNCAQMLGEAPENCLVIEDAQSGIDAARSAGMCAVGICINDRLENTDLNIESISELPIDLLMGKEGI